MNNVINYEQLLDNYHDRIREPNTYLSDKENRQFKLLHKWWIKENFTEEQLEKIRNEDIKENY